MKQNIIIKSLLLTAALLGLTAAAARADESRPASPVPASGTMGLLGQTYASLTYNYVDLDNSPVSANDYGFGINQAMGHNLDVVLSYDWMQSGVFAGTRAYQQTLGTAVRAFSTSYAWGKPYLEGGAGYTWTKVAGIRDNSLVLEAAVGAEFQVAPAVTVTPYVQFVDTPYLDSETTWNFGVKANYWVNSQWAVSAGIRSNDDHDMTYTVGTNFRF